MLANPIFNGLRKSATKGLKIGIPYHGSNFIMDVNSFYPLQPSLNPVFTSWAPSFHHISRNTMLGQNLPPWFGNHKKQNHETTAATGDHAWNRSGLVSADYQDEGNENPKQLLCLVGVVASQNKLSHPPTLPTDTFLAPVRPAPLSEHPPLTAFIK